MPIPEYHKRLMDFTSAALSQVFFFFFAKRDYPACHLAVTAISSYRAIITRDAMYERIIERSGEVSLDVDRQTEPGLRPWKQETIARKRSRRDEELFRFDRLCVRIHIFCRLLTSLTLFIKLLINAMKDFNTTTPRLSRANELLP